MKKRIFFIYGIIFLAAVSVFLAGCSQKPDEWTITQYGPRETNSMFYTIHNPRRGLIIIDGGWEEDGDYVREVLKKLGNHVDAWILTHPHQDHVGAFINIYPNRNDLKIDCIYTVDLASPQICQERAPWDSVETYQRFLALNVPDLQYLYAGDVLNLCGLKLSVFNSYDEHVQELSKDYLNDGSLMFKVSGETQSMLFCADVGKSMSKYLYRTWGDQLQATYLQMGHHGYGGLKDAFYKKVHPEVAFFDAPDSMMLDTSGTYDNPEHVRLMEELGSKIVSFCSAPNSVTLK